MSNLLCLLPKLINKKTKFYLNYFCQFQFKKRVKDLTRFFDLMQFLKCESVAKLTILTLHK